MVSPLHLCLTTWNVAVVKRWIEVASSEEIVEAIDVPSRVGTTLSMAIALKKDHEAICNRFHVEDNLVISSLKISLHGKNHFQIHQKWGSCRISLMLKLERCNHDPFMFLKRIALELCAFYKHIEPYLMLQFNSVQHLGQFEILSLCCSFMVCESDGQRSRTGGLSVSLSGPHGRVIGGNVAGLLTAASPIQMIVGSIVPASRKQKKTKAEVVNMDIIPYARVDVNIRNVKNTCSTWFLPWTRRVVGPTRRVETGLGARLSWRLGESTFWTRRVPVVC
uniref:AT-hook motif nuclear-localized protein n=1 Tax=Lactuca sativa TaxID=4236 RepID=A0A9R1UXN4_LACSA|nr:hypothetical protein LSAT_V11C700350160 [Lactuca sativa]